MGIKFYITLYGRFKMSIIFLSAEIRWYKILYRPVHAFLATSFLGFHEKGAYPTVATYNTGQKFLPYSI